MQAFLFDLDTILELVGGNRKMFLMYLFSSSSLGLPMKNASFAVPFCTDGYSPIVSRRSCLCSRCDALLSTPMPRRIMSLSFAASAPFSCPFAVAGGDCCIDRVAKVARNSSKTECMLLLPCLRPGEMDGGIIALGRNALGILLRNHRYHVPATIA